MENEDFDPARVRIFNQVSEVRSVRELAEIVAELFDVPYESVENPRKELAENELEVSNEGLVSLGFEPITLNQGLLNDVKVVADACVSNFDRKNVLSSPKW